ncbi:MAG: hypothetical protein M1840_001771 [Geoglossum simile]|nr:MAG: hypothetical protein M1840_001771 [Geoglossum simile]
MGIVHALFYRRPTHIGAPRSPGQKSFEQSINSGATSVAGIPDALSFDRIIAGGTCPPCTTREFMNYLKYVEFAAENLQFFLWYTDYKKRFEHLDSTSKLLAPEWTATQIDAEIMLTQSKTTTGTRSREAPTIFQGTMFDLEEKAVSSEPAVNPFATPNGSLASDSASNFRGTSNATSWEFGGGDLGADSARNYAKTAASAFENAKLNWQPFTVQPFRDEIARIIAIYIAKGAPRELNISARERASVLYALRNTTHPSAFRAAASTIECSLRQQSHPNFVRWAIYNGNPARVAFARSLGIGCIVSGFVLASVLTISHVGPGWRAFAAVLWFLGTATLFAAWKGMCIVLHGLHRRQVPPWELFTEDKESAYELRKTSSDSMSSTNSFGNEPWVPRYGSRSLIRRIFDSEVWIQEPALRQIQDIIFAQSLVLGFVAASLLTVIFVVIPSGNKF